MPKEIKLEAEPLKKYCSHCGRKLNLKIEPAEKFTFFDKFNEKNGKRNFINVIYCSKYNSFFGYSHDCYAIGETFNF